MSEYELMYLRFLQAKRDFPELNHQPEHGPQVKHKLLIEWIEEPARDFCEREFNRSA